jgi:hypothetical protein
MVDFVNYWAHEIMKHVPMITYVGMGMALVLGMLYVGKRWRECALLGVVCAAYAITPYMPHL